MTDKIAIKDLELHFHVGVPEEERSEPQKLLITIEMTLDLGPSGATDNLAETIDYYAVSQAVKTLGQARRWKLIEALADDICQLVLTTSNRTLCGCLSRNSFSPTPAGLVLKCHAKRDGYSTIRPPRREAIKSRVFHYSEEFFPNENQSRVAF